MAQMSWSCVKRNKEKFLWFWWGEGCWYDRRKWKYGECTKQKEISRLKVQFPSDKERLCHSGAQKLATFLISSPAKVFILVFWWVVWLYNGNKLKNIDCSLQIHFVINLLGLQSVNCETDYIYICTYFSNGFKIYFRIIQSLKIEWEFSRVFSFMLT